MWILLIPLPTPHNLLSPTSTSFPYCYLSFSNPLGTMDPIKIEKLQAMKRYRRKQSFATVIQSCLTVLMLGLFLFSLLWLPKIFCSMKFFFLVSLPDIGAIVFRPKFLFLVSNIIIIFLVGESKLSKSLPTPEIYEEYVARRQSLQRLSNGEVMVVEGVMEEIAKEESSREESVKEPSIQETKEKDEEGEKSVGVDDDEDEEEEVEEEMVVEMDREREELDEEEEMGLPAEELKRRVEDFIAKFNMQRRLEARMLDCYG